MKVDFSYYKAVNKNQTEFHESAAKHKLLIGPYRSGKTYPAIHEALFICMDNPGHEFAVFRNTQKSLEQNVQKDFIAVADAAGAIKGGLSKGWKKSEGTLTLVNDCKVRFLTLIIKREQLKGMNMCGFLIDDPDVTRYQQVISFLFTRLTNPPNVKAKYFATVICANYEGHDWLWQKYMRRRKPGGNGMFAYWFCKTEDNPTLEDDYIETQAAVHSPTWMERYIYGNQDGYVGLIYGEYDPLWHDADLSWCFHDHGSQKIMVFDPGINHPAVVESVASDGQNIYFYDEWYKLNQRTHDVGDYLLTKYNSKEMFRDLLIDPKACAREQTSGVSPRQVLKDDFGIRRIKLADNSEKPGIECMKGIMTLRKDPKDSENMITHFFVDPVRCPHLVKELETVKWKEPEYSEFDELAYKEQTEDKDNDATDCARYACVYFKKKLISMRSSVKLNLEGRDKHWENRFKNLKIYQRHPEGVVETRASFVRKLHYERKREQRVHIN